MNSLSTNWVWWEQRIPKSLDDYSESMVQMCEFDSVEGFWQLFNNVPAPSKIFQTSTEKRRFVDREVNGYSVFLNGVRPEWEDIRNTHGGELSFRKSISLKLVDTLWLELLLFMCSNKFCEITGCRIVDKSSSSKLSYKVELWFDTRDSNKIQEMKQSLVSHHDMFRFLEHKNHS